MLHKCNHRLQRQTHLLTSIHLRGQNTPRICYSKVKYGATKVVSNQRRCLPGRRQLLGPPATRRGRAKPGQGVVPHGGNQPTPFGTPSIQLRWAPQKLSSLLSPPTVQPVTSQPLYQVPIKHLTAHSSTRLQPRLTRPQF